MGEGIYIQPSPNTDELVYMNGYNYSRFLYQLCLCVLSRVVFWGLEVGEGIRVYINVSRKLWGLPSPSLSSSSCFSTGDPLFSLSLNKI